MLTAHRLSNEEQKKANENGFVVVLYKKLFDNVRELLGKYVSSCNPKYLSFMLDFMMTVEKRMNFMDSTEMDKFFFNNREEIKTMLEYYNKWEKTLRNEQYKYLSQIKDLITKKTNGQWWIYQDWDLGVSFQDNTQYRIGIESEFKPTKDDPIGEFHIYITTWRIDCWQWYKDSILKRYPIDKEHLLDEGMLNTYNRVYYHMPVIKRVDYKGDEYINEIVKRLEEYFLFLKQESEKYM